MSRAVVIVGGGAAGLAAAWSARRAGATVTVVGGRPGASALGGGAVDDIPWERVVRASRALGAPPPPREVDPEVTELARALELWDVPAAREPGTHLATVAGRLRPARGRDRALLDLSFLEGARVLVPRAERAGWDADAIAAALAAEPFARARGLAFAAVDGPVLRFDDERRIGDGDLAARHDDEQRLGWLADRLRAIVDRETMRGGAAHAVLLGPWLGARSPRAEALGARAGVRVGEALAGAGSPAGLRFEAARDRLLGAIGARVVPGLAAAVRASGDDLEVTLASSSKGTLGADAVVLAVGGVAGGGIVYRPADHAAGEDLPPRAGAAFCLSLDAPVQLSTSEGPVDVVSSLHGPDLDVTAWPSGDRDGDLETIGIRSGGRRPGAAGARAEDRVFAAGDAVACRPRTLLEAVASGLRAGRDAAS